MNSTNTFDLSVVVISRNEEEMIADCIESLLSALKYAKDKNIINSYEIILSDSASTDKTIEIAKSYPIKIIQLRPEWKLSASAGRYIGSQLASGKFIFFTDGDCKVYKEWFVQAIPYLNNEDIGGVDGYEREYIAKNNFFYNFMEEERKKDEKSTVMDVGWVGKAIFKREILEKSCNYNPWLRGCEERDLSFRIKKLGYRLIRLPVPSVLHHWAKKDGQLQYWTIVKTMKGWSLGDGQMLKTRKYDRKTVNEVLKRYFSLRMILNYYPLLFLIELLLFNTIGIITLPSMFTIIALVLDLAFIITILFWKVNKKSTLATVIYIHFQQIPYAIIRCGFLVIGFFNITYPIKNYPTDAIIIV